MFPHPDELTPPDRARRAQRVVELLRSGKDGVRMRRTRKVTTKPAVYSVTGARSSLSDDVKSRQRRYAAAMSIRTLCFVLCVFTPSPLKWIFFTGALVLPYFAVVMANAGREGGG